MSISRMSLFRPGCRGSVIKKALTDKFVQKEAENCLKAIPNIILFLMMELLVE